MTTRTTPPCISCGKTGGYIRPDRTRPDRTRGLCDACKHRELKSGAYWDRPLSGWHGPATHVAIPTGFVTPAMIGIQPGQPPTDPGLTPRKVWEIAHLNARKAIHWLVNTGRMTPDEAAALVMLSYAPPTDAARRAA